MPAKKPAAKPAKATIAAPVYQLKITLKDFRPPIWRRVLVPGSADLYRLHWVVQIAMGWTNSHLHQFIIDGEYYSIPSEDDWEAVKDERRLTLAQIAPAARRKFVYEYDFGDSWEHEILVEKILPPDPAVKHAVCLDGRRACPPEDVGGVWGYAEFLEAIRNPEHEEHDSYLEWIGGDFDPDEFDVDAVNAELRRLR